MDVSSTTHCTAVDILAHIYLADAPTSSVGECCGMVESDYREIEWAVLSMDAQPIEFILTKKSTLNLRECSNDGR